MRLTIMLLGFLFQLSQPQNPDIAVIRRWIGSHSRQDLDEVEPVLIKELGDYTGGSRFYTVHFREYPLAHIAPAPLSSRNVFVIDAAGPKLFSTRKEFEAVFPSLLSGPVSWKDTPKVLKGFLDISKEFSQDGFFKFSIPESRFTLAGNFVATGFAVVEPKGGDRGELRAILTFKPQGVPYRLQKIEEKDTIQPGVRPICQATKLLDPDPVVRKMAVRDLLVMGIAARPYLLEKRANASPKLRKAIDRIWDRILRGER